VRKVNEYTIIDFLDNLSNESWESTFNTENVDLMFNSFLNTYLRIFYSSFPPIRINSRKNKKTWITQGIRKSCKHKRELFLLTKNSNNPTLNRHYKVYCNILTKVINEAKKMYYNKRIINSTNKTKSTWKIINELLGKQHSSNDIQKLTIEDKHFTNQNDIANLLNQHFSTVVDKLNCNNENNESYNNFSTCLPNKGIQDQIPSLVFKSFSTHEIINIIKSLKTKESYGYDEISTKPLKISANYICSPLTHICNKAIAAGIFPQRLKYSIIKPLFKKGDKTKPSNYRPISLLTTFSKVLEKALFNRLIENI
jgi:hypothetical protein